MGTPQGRPEPAQQPAQRAIAAATYVVLFVLGALQGLIGCFNYGRSPVPLVAIILAVVIFATCVLAGWGTRTFGGGLAPAVGWIIVSLVLSMGRPNGSIIITNTAAGQWYLYGGSLAAVTGTAAAYILWVRGRPRPR
jgi:peptidoglycan/LPS O-acetylase OafA/YrhL